MPRLRRARGHDQTAVGSVGEGRDGAFYLAGVAHIDRAYINSERGSGCPDGAKLSDAGGIGGISEHGGLPDAGQDLLEEFEPFAAQTVFEQHKAGNIATWPS